MSEVEVISTLKMDRSEAIGNSPDNLGRRALHVKNASQFISERFDSIFATYPNPTTEVFTYKLAGTTVATITVIYQDASKHQFTSIVRT